MMDFARVAAFDHEAGAGAQSAANHLVVQPGARQQRRNRRHLRGDAAVGKDDQAGAPARSPRTPRSISDCRAEAMPAARSATGKSIWSVSVVKPRQFLSRLSRASSSLSRIGISSAICRQFSGPGSSRFPSAPAPVNTEVTSSSRMASSGGLVTWAKSCLK